MGVDRYRVCELYAAGPDAAGSGSGYRLGDRLVVTAWHVIAPPVARAGGQVLVRPVGVREWLPAGVEWQDADTDAALVGIEEEGWRAPGRESVLRWGELAGSDPVPCAAVGFPWASVRPDRVRETAHLYGQLAPLGQLKAGRLDLDVASASPSAREGGSPWAGMSGAGVIADSHLVGVITVDPARYPDRLVAVPVTGLLADERFRARLAAHGVPGEAAPVGTGWYLRLPGGQTVSLAPAYRPVSRRFGPALPTLLRPEHGLVPFLGRQDLLDRVTGWCQDPATDRPLLLVTGGGGSGKTRLGREACVQMLVAGWDAGLADDQRRDGIAITRLQRPTLLVIDDADLRTGLISALVGYLRWDDAGPPVRLLLLARAAGTWWDRLVRQQELPGSYTVLDLDRHPVPPGDRAEHFRCASTAFAPYHGPGAPPADAPPPAGLDDPVYADPLLIHIAALLRTVDTSATSPPGPAKERAADEDGIAGMPVRQALLQALCERERTRWYQLGQESHLLFNPDLPLVDQVVALATLTAAGDQPRATSLLAALPNQAEVTRIGAEALVVWAHRLYSGPGYWNPLRPDLLAEQHLADTAQLAPLAAATAQLAAGQGWEAGLFTRLLAELTRGAPTQPAVRAALSELLGAALPRIVKLAVTGGHAGLAELAGLALQLAPQPHQAALAAELAEFLGEGGREGPAIQLLETMIAAAEAGPAVPAKDVLAMRQVLARHVGMKTLGHGDPQRAREIARRVVGDSTREYGPDHRETLDAWIALARQVGAAGDPHQALTMAREVDATATAAFGAGDWTTLNARFAVALWTWEVDGAAAGAERFTELIRQAEQLEPRPQRLIGIADCMWNLASCLSEAGEHTRAIRTSKDAITLAQQAFGATHISVFDRRLTHAYVVGSSGDPQAAAELSGHLADECADIIGASHLVTLETRAAAAHWTAAAGDHAGAARRYEALLADLAGVLDDDHWLAQRCRTELAELKEQTGTPPGDEPAPGARPES